MNTTLQTSTDFSRGDAFLTLHLTAPLKPAVARILRRNYVGSVTAMATERVTSVDGARVSIANTSFRAPRTHRDVRFAIIRAGRGED